MEYSVISSSSDETKISINHGGTTIIKSLGDDKISIKTVRNQIIVYKRIHCDTNISREEVERFTKQH